MTGRCVLTDRPVLAEKGVTVCEIQSWCPVEDDRIVKGKTQTQGEETSNNIFSPAGF